MNKQFLNFSHDLALAHDCERYTPPLNVQMMEHDLAELVNLLPQTQIFYSEYAPVWGWNRSFVNKLKGLPGLPTDEQLADIRRLSSRRTAVEMLPAIRKQLPEGTTIGESWFVKNEQDLEKCIKDNYRRMIFKAPYSGSGRGLRLVDRDELGSLNLKVHKSQGGVVVEPYYSGKVADFALEYLCTPSEVSFLGLSLFSTDERNVYSGNVIAPQSVLWQRLNNMVLSFDFEQLINVVKKELACRFIGHYLGPIGVDMMIVQGDERNAKYYIHPCVEVNVRRTMGELSLHLLSLLAEGAEGLFRLIYNKDSDTLRRMVDDMPTAEYDNDGRLVSGVHLLTPLAEDTHFVALLTV